MTRSKMQVESTPLAQIRSKTVVEQTTEAIRHAILTGRYVSGEHLVERHIATELGVSSIAVREAFVHVAREGLVDQLPRRGTFVASMTPEALADLTRVRIVLEQLVVELAIDHWTDEARLEVQGMVDEMRAAARSDDPERLFAADTRFHETFWRIASSETLIEIAALLRTRVARFLRQADETVPRSGRMSIAEQHQRWLDAVASGDTARARAEVAEQITAASKRILRMGGA